MTASQLASLQSASGQIPWFPGGHCDPWNHVEAAMALTVSGYRDEARAAYRWLASSQLGDGSWFNYYLDDRRQGHAPRHQRVRLHRCGRLPLPARDRRRRLRRGYVARRGARDRIRPALAARRRHDPLVARRARDGPRPTRCSPGRRRSSTRCAAPSRSAERLGIARPAWELAAGRLGHAVAHHPGAFAPKNEFAMDWYYPIFCGALTGDAG